MSKETEPLLTDEFLDEVAREINELYGGIIKVDNEVSGEPDYS
jgi:hypothetical protein